MILTLAWRNIWRNKKRTSLLITSIILGLMALLMAMAFMNGLSISFINNAINTEFSHIQIHHPEYAQDNNPLYTIQKEDSLQTFLKTNHKVKSFTLRTKIDGLATSLKSSRGIKIIGIDPEKESEVTGIKDLISEGTYFSGETKRPLIIGRKLAEQLGVKIKSKVLLTFLNANNEITAESFRVSGIIETNSARLNGLYIFIKKEDFYKAFNQGGITHEIAIKLYNIENAASVTQEIIAFTDVNRVETWKEIAPELESSINQTRIDKMIVLIVIILAFSFGLINTMLMQVSERTREIGMLIANGMNRNKVFMMITFESIFSVAIASFIGIFLGFLVISYFNRNGMDFTSLAKGFSSQGWSKIIYPELYISDYLRVIECSLLSGFIGAALPAFKTIRLNVIAAIRKA